MAPPRVFLKRGEGISRFSRGGLAKARADALARAPQRRADSESHQPSISAPEEVPRARQSAYNQQFDFDDRESGFRSAWGVPDGETFTDAHAVVPELNEPVVTSSLLGPKTTAPGNKNSVPSLGNHGLSEFEELEAAVHRLVHCTSFKHSNSPDHFVLPLPFPLL